MKQRERTDLIVIHCSATPPDRDVTAAQIRYEHMEIRGWDDIGYHWVIRRNGEIEPGRDCDAIGAHVSGHNHNSVGISLVGGVNRAGEAENNFTPEQFSALEQVVTAMLERYPGAAVGGHRDFSPDLDGDGVIEPREWIKECPCFDAGAWWFSVWEKELREVKA